MYCHISVTKATPAVNITDPKFQNKPQAHETTLEVTVVYILAYYNENLFPKYFPTH